ncbi:MAG TPA: HAMP domain-containing sensor histidine kinase [Gemmatimonadaceae bacterium]|nr:HAMP domain-containing sensor histidine kinase [Gemmatimonadaceae bacterium]
MTHRRGVPLRVRLVVGMLMLAAILVAPLVVTRFALERLFQDIEQLQSQDFRASQLLGRLRATSDLVRRADDQIGGLRDSSGAPTLRNAVRTLRILADSLNVIAPGTAYTSVDTAVSDIERFSAVSLGAMARSDYLRMDTLSTVAVRPALARLAIAVAAAEADLRIETAGRVRGARDETKQAQRVSLTALMLALLFAAIVAAWIIFSIARPVADLQLGMERIANGQFDHKLSIASQRHDEFGRLAESYDAMAQRLGELDRLKAEFVSMASHELKTPLNVILGYLTLLDDGVYGPLNDKQRDVIHTLERQSHSLNRLVRQLLDVSKYDAGGATLDVQPLDTRAFFAELENSLVVLAQQRGVNFSVSAAPGMPTEVWWDHDRMTEAIGNLVTNACKFTPRGGVVALHGDGEPGLVRIEVRDSGVGIPAPELPHVFRKFFQAGNQDTANAAGTGLGLAIVRGIIEAHGGSVHVSSEVGVGTTFTISLPQRAQAPRRVVASVPTSAATAISRSST